MPEIEATEPLTEIKPDIKAALRKLQDAAWNCGTDEYRDGVSDAACTRRYDAMIAARALYAKLQPKEASDGTE